MVTVTDETLCCSLQICGGLTSNRTERFSTDRHTTSLGIEWFIVRRLWPRLNGLRL